MDPSSPRATIILTSCFSSTKPCMETDGSAKNGVKNKNKKSTMNERNFRISDGKGRSDRTCLQDRALLVDEPGHALPHLKQKQQRNSEPFNFAKKQLKPVGRMHAYVLSSMTRVQNKKKPSKRAKEKPARAHLRKVVRTFYLDLTLTIVAHGVALQNGRKT